MLHLPFAKPSNPVLEMFREHRYLEILSHIEQNDT